MKKITGFTLLFLLVFLTGCLNKSENTVKINPDNIKNNITNIDTSQDINTVIESTDQAKIKKCNPSSVSNKFIALGNDYIKDNNCVYLEQFGDGPQELMGADPLSFIPLVNNNYSPVAFYHGKDNNGVYYHDIKIINSDPVTFIVLGNVYGKDKNGVYYGAQAMNGVDLQSFEVLSSTQISDIDNYSYAKDKKFVYYEGKKIEEADTNSFELLSNYFAKDNSFAYSSGEKINGADSVSFQALGTFYAKDKNYAYNTEGVLRGIDAKSFKIFKNWRYSSDINGVYYYGKGKHKLDNVDIASFITLKEEYGKDKNNVYNRGNIIIGFEANSFEVLTETLGWPADEKPIYVKDEKIVKINDQTLSYVHANSFQLMKDGYYAKDRSNIYWYGVPIEGVDYESFQVINDTSAKDKSNKFINGEIH